MMKILSGLIAKRIWNISYDLTFIIDTVQRGHFNRDNVETCSLPVALRTEEERILSFEYRLLTTMATVL